MKNNEYHLVTKWEVNSTAEEVYEILSDTTGLSRWWPSVYLNVEQISPGDDNGIGKQARLLTKGWLPYTLSWEFEVIEARKPFGLTIAARGDLNGRGTWKFEQDGDRVNITYDWFILADKPLLNYLSFVLKPVFSANHRWAMKKGEQSLKLEIARRHANTPQESATIPDPPGPVRGLPVLILTAVILILALLWRI